MLEIKNIETGYDKKQVLFDISFTINKGDIALIIGSNGSGKSTILKTIYGINKTWKGTVRFQNEDITNVPSNTLLQKGIMYIPQKDNLFEQLTVKENIEISGLALQNNLLFKQRLQEVLEMFPMLKSFLSQIPMKMSGGERQQLVLAMALIHQPKLLLIDEPFTGLSPKAIQEVTAILKAINNEKSCTIVMVEHRVKEAIVLASKLVGIKYGKIALLSEKKLNFDNLNLNEIFL